MDPLHLFYLVPAGYIKFCKKSFSPCFLDIFNCFCPLFHYIGTTTFALLLQKEAQSLSLCHPLPVISRLIFDLFNASWIFVTFFDLDLMLLGPVSSRPDLGFSHARSLANLFLGFEPRKNSNMPVGKWSSLIALIRHHWRILALRYKIGQILHTLEEHGYIFEIYVLPI